MRGSKSRRGSALWGQVTGVDLFGSRDCRNLGTIGQQDAVYLPLKKGKNEVWFPVGEIFGGGGVQTCLDKGSGARIAP